MLKQHWKNQLFVILEIAQPKSVAWLLYGNQTRSNIRKVDRLYGNVHLQRESLEIYDCIIKQLVKTHQPIVLIDDTKLPRSNYSSLRLSLASSRRSLTLYEIVYNKKKSKGYVRCVCKELLDNFESMLPANCKPIFVSDAAFSEPFSSNFI